MKAFALCLSLLSCSYVHAAEVTVPTVHQVDPAANCSNDGPTVISVGSVDGTYLYGTASYERFLCKLQVHAGRGPGYVYLSGCADVVWSAATGELVSLSYQGTSCPQ